MGDMLDNRSFEGGGDSAETEVSTEPQQDVTSEENTEAQPSESTEETQETNNIETESESSEKPQEDIVEDTTENNEEAPQDEHKPTRAQKRITKILAEKKALEARLAQKPQVNNQQVNNQFDGFQVDDNGELEMTPTQLNEMISNQVQNTLNIERQQQFVQQRADAWDDDITELMDSTPELNPKSKVFNKGLSDALVDLINVVNVDDNGNRVVRKLPSEVFATINSSISAAKTSGKQEASAGLQKQAENAAVQSSVSDQKETAKYNDEDLANMQITDPRKYAELIENNEI
ncbi:MAG: hypothetical protein U9P50_02645 [Patescibacteria group bacterium]|nr:hypothetical protein [Patescibacteria group bacterium]